MQYLTIHRAQQARRLGVASAREGADPLAGYESHSTGCAISVRPKPRLFHLLFPRSFTVPAIQGRLSPEWGTTEAAHASAKGGGHPIYTATPTFDSLGVLRLAFCILSFCQDAEKPNANRRIFHSHPLSFFSFFIGFLFSGWVKRGRETVRGTCKSVSRSETAR